LGQVPQREDVQAVGAPHLIDSAQKHGGSGGGRGGGGSGGDGGGGVRGSGSAAVATM
jgi:hypothetical protein